MAEPFHSVDLPSSDDWTFFKLARGGGTAVVAVNDGLRAFKGRAFFPYHLTVSIDAQQAGADGLPDERESAVIDALGFEIDRALLSQTNDFGDPIVLYLARSTWNGVHERVYRVHAPQKVDAALQYLLRTGHWKRVWRYEIKHDESWVDAAHYLSLYPA